MKHEVARYRLADFLSGNQQFLVGWTRFAPGEQSRQHDHDFAEFFWVLSGGCRHQHALGEEWLEPGDLRWVCPEHQHAFAAGEERADIVNIAMPSSIIDGWARLYPALEGKYFWNPSPRPEGFRLDEEERKRMADVAEYLSRRDDSLMVLHQQLLRLFIARGPGAPGPSCPEWLQRGMREVARREVFAGGVPAFVKRCGRSAEHVSRTCRRLLGKTPVDLVNDARMQYAARQLQMSDTDILSIMMDCGLANPSHFYDLFRRQFGMTPRKYRLQRWQ